MGTAPAQQPGSGRDGISRRELLRDATIARAAALRGALPAVAMEQPRAETRKPRRENDTMKGYWSWDRLP